VWWVAAGVGDRHGPALRLLVAFCSAAARVLPGDKRVASDVGEVVAVALCARSQEPARMTVAQITPPARTDALAGQAYCLPVVRELPGPVADPVGERTW